MTPTFRELERVEARVLGALRFVDSPTGTDITRPLVLRALDGRAVFVRNRSGLWILDSWSELASHAAAFLEPLGTPAPGSRTLRVSVTDPLGLYLPRRVSLALPRDPDAEDEGDSLFRPVEVAMYPAAGAATRANWSVLRVRVSEDGTGDALGGALVLVTRTAPGGGNGGGNGGGPPPGRGGPPPGRGRHAPPPTEGVIARGVTDGRGEALVALVGVPLLTFGEDEDAVIVDEVAVTVEAFFDPSVGTRAPADALRAGATPPTPEVDPDTLEADSDSLPQAAVPLAVAARRSQAVSMAIDLP